MHHHFVTNPWYGHHAILRAGPTLCDTEPARTLLIRAAIAIPWELHFHPAMLITIDLFAVRADHFPHGRKFQDWFVAWCHPPHLITAHRSKLVGVRGGTAATGFFQRLRLAALMGDLNQQIIAIHLTIQVFVINEPRMRLGLI
ncbi:hypothetical protein VSP9026_04334 [Vibrio spartinae]|uniref:Uncharacterized protein n=1 Tax=Vibrio spartinae TaxID=1918945 RepID=A0A1N6MAU3_9VIBR|nr:hypothetical protein VSP9026_04334 [Vibrio spartinae]